MATKREPSTTAGKLANLKRRLVRAEECIIALQVNDSTNAEKIAEEAGVRRNDADRFAIGINKLTDRIAALEAKLAERQPMSVRICQVTSDVKAGDVVAVAPPEPEIPAGYKRELPADVTAAGWVACEWEEAQEMGGNWRAGIWPEDTPVVGRWWPEDETDIVWVKLEPKK